jgi:extracellular factor (EF) 3-hydroxypalmitic acid methyl ester biosynthesis protein
LPEDAASPDSLVLFKNSRGLAGRGTLLHLTRHHVALEVYNPYSIVQLSEVLEDVRILRRGYAIYRGKAVVTTLVPTGAVTIVSATLVDAWSDLRDIFDSDEVRAEAVRFIENWTAGSALRPGYQLAVNQLASFLQELSRWLGQAEALYATQVGRDLAELVQEVWPPVEEKLTELFASFEHEAASVPADAIPMHKTFAQRELHPLLLCDPFIHRSVTKPLGYAGDYQVVNMMLEAKALTTTTYARVVSAFHLTRPPAIAHRNRVHRLEDLLRQEARRRADSGERLSVLNIGCGPAREIERLLAAGSEAQGVTLTLVDFNEETLRYATEQLARVRARAKVQAEIVTVHQSIHELLRAAASGQSTLGAHYDFVYCAGLFDYLSDRVCTRLVQLFYDWTAPGGLLVTTNVHAKNPFRHYMTHIAEWYLEYRDEHQFLNFASGKPAVVTADITGVNLFLELRKPAA